VLYRAKLPATNI